MSLYLLTDNHGLLLLATLCKGLALCVFLGICYFMGNQYLKETRKHDKNWKEPKTHNNAPIEGKEKSNKKPCKVGCKCTCKKNQSKNEK